ncbi:MAG: PAS domain S-box protein, partial [Candidatus Binatia bacterium]
MIWKSIAVMTLIDLVIIAVTSASLWIHLKSGPKLHSSGSSLGSFMVAMGLVGIGLFYLFDLFTMFGLPLFTTRVAAMVVMKNLHLNYSWLLILFAVTAISTGFAITNRRLFTLISDLQKTKAELGEKLSKNREFEEMLQKSEDRFHKVVESMPTGIVLVNREGKIVLVNSKVEQVFGYDRGDLVGQRVEILVPKRYRSKHLKYRANLPEVKNYRPMGAGRKLSGLRKDGSEFPIEIGLSEVRVQEGTLTLAAMVDITERKQAEGELQARFKEVQSLHEVSEAILGSLDLKCVLDEILNKALLVTGLDIGNIRLVDHGEQTIGLVSSKGYRDPENVKRHYRNIIDAPTGRMSLQVLAMKHPRVEEDVLQVEGLNTFKREGVRSAVAIPVRAREEVLGVMQLGSRTPRKFQTDEVRFLEALGYHVGIAVQKIRLHEQTLSKANELSALYSVATVVNQSL